MSVDQRMRQIADAIEPLFDKYEIATSADFWDELNKTLASEINAVCREERAYWQEFIRLNFK